jgi:hypothetical protein
MGLQVQSELPGEFILDTGYLGSHGYKLFARNYINVIDPATGLRPLPAFGQIDIKRTDGVSSFNAWQTSIHKQWLSGWLISANYMWSHSLNDGAVGGGEADYPEIASCRSCDYSDSDQDVRHSFTMNTVYELPFGRNRKYLNGPGATKAKLDCGCFVDSNQWADDSAVDQSSRLRDAGRWNVGQRRPESGPRAGYLAGRRQHAEETRADGARFA